MYYLTTHFTIFLVKLTSHFHTLHYFRPNTTPFQCQKPVMPPKPQNLLQFAVHQTKNKHRANTKNKYPNTPKIATVRLPNLISSRNNLKTNIFTVIIDPNKPKQIDLYALAQQKCNAQKFYSVHQTTSFQN